MSNAVIMLVDDLEEDVLLVQRAFLRAKFTNPVHVVRSREEAIAYLKGDNQYAKRDEYPLPSLVLLDLKMPGMDGFDVLKWIRKEPSLKAIRVVVLTSSDQIRDVNEAYRLGANSFMVKPMDFQNYVAMSASLKDYWLNRSETPEVARPESTPTESTLRNRI